MNETSMASAAHPATDSELFPLSFAQERIWMLHQIDPHCLAYHVPLGIRLIGPLDRRALEAAVNHLIRRHEVMRATVVLQADIPYQRALPETAISLETVDVRFAAADREAALRELTTRETRQPFDLVRGPLWRVTLLRCSDQDHVFVMTMHHMITDGWSRNILREELETLYDAYSKGRRPELPALPVQYADYADWQRQDLPSAAQDSSLDYWRKQLLDAPGSLDFPLDRPRPAQQSYRGLSRSIFLEGELISALRALAQQNSTTLFMVLFGAFTVLISRYTRQDDLVIGSPVAGRNRIEIERLVGFFINLIALRINLSGDPTFLELLNRVRETAVGAYAHQETPFENVVHEVVRDRSLNLTPLFQVLFQLKNYPRRKEVCDTLRFQEYEIETESSQFDFAFDLGMTPDGISCRCDFAADLFDPATIELLLGHFRKLLQEVVIDPERPISSLPLLTETGRSLTPSGNLDEKAISKPLVVVSNMKKEYAAPQTPMEALLASIWCEVLGLARVGRHDNFFELGGHSLAAMRVLARCRRQLAMEIPIKLIFTHPTIAGLACCVDADERQRPWLADLTAQRPVPVTTPLDLPEFLPQHAPSFDAANMTDEAFPLALSQQRLYFLDQLGGNESVFNITEVWQVNGRLNVESFRSALNAIVVRHEPLRTVYGIRNEEPFQSVQLPRPFVLPVHDLRNLPDAARAVEERRLAVAAAETPFPLATAGQLLRAQLLWTADQRHVLLLTVHHLACDGLSLQVLWQELQLLYEADLRGDHPSLEDLPCRFADYVYWQQVGSRSLRFQQELDYWRNQLAGLTPLELPSDRPRPHWSSHRGARQAIRLCGELVQRVRRLGRETGTTLHITLMTAFQVLLHRYSQQADIAVGVPIQGRLKAEFEPLIGMFVNTLALRGNFSGTSTFRSALEQMHAVSVAAYDHQQIPFDTLVEELQPERHAGRNPLVQVLFQLLETSAPQPWENLEFVRQTAPSQRCHVDLEMLLRPDGDEISGELIYSTDLFDAATIVRLAEHYRQLLEAVVVQPELPIDRIPWLSEPERQQLLVAWNDTHRDLPELCVHELFERQAAQRPDSIALVAGDQTWTYGLLSRRSNRLAHRLRALGVGPESRVGISLERSPGMMVGVLAILKAGGAYVPLDPRYPPERWSFLLEDSGVSLVLTQRDLAENWRHLPASLLCLDDRAEDWTSESDVGPTIDISLDHPAYVMYTSGSTGAPKGVEVLHRGIVRLVCGADYVDLDETQSILQLATLSFDASTFEIWGPLLNGGRCVLAPPELLDPAELAQLLQRERVRTMWLTSTMFNILIDEMPSALAGIEQLLVGGEALSVPHIRRAQQALGPRTQLINGYGPTESTTFACCYRLPHDIPADWMSIPIGRPISNTTAYVLDPLGQLVPIGIPGELHIGGEGLARGYLNRPELTAQQFVTNPFSADPHSRLYRTGDRVRWRADGQLEFLGRLDQQLKIRGFRIEPGEIESVLRQHPELRDAAVTATDDPATGGKQLVAYLVLNQWPARATSDWRSWLASRIPAYMIPADFVELERFPRTPGGKVDRGLLPAPSRSAARSRESAASPMSALETRMAEVWCEALQLPRIERDDNFFDLGGHSLLALRVAARLSAALDRSVPVALFFQCPTVAAMADVLEKTKGSSADAVIMEMRSGNEQSPLFLFPPIGAEFFSFRDLVRALPTPRAVYAVDWHAGNATAPFNSLQDIARHCAEHIQKFRPSGPYLLAGYSFGGRLAFETACRLLDAGEDVALVAILDAGPGKTSKHTWHERLLGVGRFLQNLPRWIYHDLLADSAASLAGRLRRKAKQGFRRIQRQRSMEGKSEAKTQLADLFDDHQFPPWFQQRQHADLLAAARYQPVPYPLKVTLFRARVRPLLHGHLTDVTWRRVAKQGVEVHDIPGNHGTMLRPPFVQNLARELADAMHGAE